MTLQNRKIYHLIGPDGQPYESYEKGTLGGYRGGGARNLYGRLDCPAALAALARPTHASYEAHRVFFKDEATAIAAGFRPCGRCMPEAYEDWKNHRGPWAS
ncbi:metal-binding protein [Candidatus Saccharibacteria bacterium]|nr:metal-binding protein [Candidatus Saccharibacteria bacterium]